MAALLLAAALTEAAEPAARDEVLNLDEAAALLRVQPEDLRALAEAQRVPARRIGESWRFSRAALLDWLKNSRGQGGSDAALAAPVGERPSAPSAAEVALRDQRLLLRRREAMLDLALAYARAEEALLPIVRTEQRSFALSATLRYGMADDLQGSVRVPAIWRRVETLADASVSGSTAPSVTKDAYIGDPSVSLTGVAWRESVGRPNVLWSVDAVLPAGAGDKALGAGLVFSKSYDPAVIFAGLNYLHGFSIDPADARRSLATHNVGASFGYIYALNDALALSTVFTGTYRNTPSPDGLSIRPSRERHQLQLGMTWLATRGVFIEPAVAMRLGGTETDLGLSLTFSLAL